MIDLARLESRLNDDLKLRQQFLTDPAAVLRREGFVMSLAQERRLRAAVAKIQSSRHGKVIAFD